MSGIPVIERQSIAGGKISIGRLLAFTVTAQTKVSRQKLASSSHQGDAGSLEHELPHHISTVTSHEQHPKNTQP